MRTIRNISYEVGLVIVVAILTFTASCKKENANEIKSLPTTNSQNEQSVFSPWQERSSGVPSGQGIIEMSEPDQVSCYGIIFDGNFNFTRDITITHDRGKTWHAQTIAELQNNFLLGVAASDAKTVHVFGWNYATGGGNVFRSTDGGTTWRREAGNAFTNGASFPDNIKFFTPNKGVMFGDPVDGYFEIYTTSNCGNSWSRVPSNKIPAPLPGETGGTFLADTYLNTIWTVTVIYDNGNPVSARLLQSDDLGATWYVRNAHLSLERADATIKFRNQSVGLFKNNGTLYRTTDGGTIWNVVNYSGKWFSFDFDNVPGKNGWWVSTGGGPAGTATSEMGSSISYDDGDHWITLDAGVNHTCVDINSSTHGYSGGISMGSGNDGVFVYQP